MLKFKILTIIFICVISISVVYYSSVSKTPEEQAWSQVTNIVQNRLKNPKSAVFPPYKKNHGSDNKEEYALLVSMGDGRFAFATHVDSKNEFGAVVRDRCAGIIRRDDDKWAMDKLDFVKISIGSGVIY
jgi:hypothetical protein